VEAAYQATLCKKRGTEPSPIVEKAMTGGFSLLANHTLAETRPASRYIQFSNCVVR
jgi:hypothetical protein